MKFLVVILALISIAHAQICANGQGGTYTIKSGDTFYNLAGQNWGLMCALMNANPTYYSAPGTYVNPCNLVVGQTIVCPSYATSTQCTSAELSLPCVTTIGTAPSGYYGSGTYGTYYNSGSYYAPAPTYYAPAPTYYAPAPAPAPAYYAPAPTYYAPAPAPAYYAPAPTYYAPAPTYYAPAPTYNNGGYYATGSGCPAGCYGAYSIPSGFTYYNAAGGNQACISAIAGCNPSYNPSALTVGAAICLPSCASNAGLAAYSYGK
jgi:hypothetical protein